jgi:hypothetical protein
MGSLRETLKLGWREWVALPELDLGPIKAKVDTGARTSAIHAFALRTFEENGTEFVEFKVHPTQKNNEYVSICRAKVFDRRVVTDSGGHKEERIVIETMLEVGEHRWPIEATLTARDTMLFRMLLGRTALRGRAVVDPARSYLVGKAVQET